MNFPNSIPPKFNLIISNAENLQKVERDLKFAQTGMLKFTKKYWMENYGFKEEEISSMDNC
ncbi:MAG: hypothetical protein V1779_00095 [bacterium]